MNIRDSLRSWFVEQMAMYAAYHTDRRNQATHHLGVPVIVFSLFLILHRTPLPLLPGTAAMLLLAVLLAVYLIAEPLLGLAAAVMYLPLNLAAYELGLAQPQLIWPLFAALFIGGWALQLLGHALEGRRPALTDNLLQIFMAPAFLLAELLFQAGLLQGLRAEIARRRPRYAATG